MEWLLYGGAFVAGFIDAVVGGGGLIQIPLLFSVLPGVSPGAVFGTNKLSSVFGTASAALRYARRVDMPWRIVVPATAAALVMAYAGAAAVAWMPPVILRPLVLVLLIAVATYTYLRKDLGRESRGAPLAAYGRAPILGLGAALGFYDGFFGPGTGSFLIFILVRHFGLDFLRASAASKLINMATNIGALAYFLPNEGVLLAVGLGMAACNVAGAQLGVHLALRHGSDFIRRVFLLTVSALILKFAYDMLR